VSKFSADGSSLLYSTFLGGNGRDYAYSIVVDSFGYAYVTGETESANFPTTPGAYKTTPNGGTSDAFVTKLNANGTALLSSTFLGGSGNDVGRGIAVDNSGTVYITGYSESANFPTTPGAFDTTHNPGLDAFVTKMTAISRNLTLTVSSLTVEYEAKPILQATLLQADTQTPYANKPLTFKLNGVTLKTVKTDANGVAALNWELGNTPLGNYSLVVSYPGDADFNPISVTTTLKIVRSKVKIVLAPAVLTTKYRLGQPMSPVLSFTLTRTSDNVRLSNETFDVILNGATIGTVTTDANGVATFPYTPPASLGAGTKVLKAFYLATATYSGLTTTWSLNFIKTPTLMALPSVMGNKNTNVNLIATLTNKVTSEALEGKTVKFFVGGGYVGQATTDASGVATCPYMLGGTAQKQTLTATFEGDDLFAAVSKNSTLTTK
jgi:hypothetical protein